MIRYYRCENCGKRGIDASPRQEKRFCSSSCSSAWHNKHRWPGKVCKFNEGVVCGDHKCKNCGWNPAVAERKKMVLYECTV